jgi:hypothetical protein
MGIEIKITPSIITYFPFYDEGRGPWVEEIKRIKLPANVKK